MANPWMNSDDLLDSVKRKISFPASQNTFTDEDILKFANEEMFISQVPSILSFHEEYFVTTETVDIVANTSRYSIPNRAIGMKLRGVFWQDTDGNQFEMTRISSEERAFFQSNSSGSQPFQKFYLEGDYLVLVPQVGSTVSDGTALVFVYWLRPNQLVETDRAAIISSFFKTVTVNNATLTAGDTITVDAVVFTAVAGSPSTNEFQIGGSSIASATNLCTAINTNGVLTATNSGTALVTMTYSDVTNEFSTSDTAAFAIATTIGINTTEVPDNITASSYVDILQTKPGHKTLAMSVLLGSNTVSSTTILFDEDDLPDSLIVGDYICSENECIIPQIPPDLHNGLAERTGARILAALGDQQGLQASNEKIKEIENAQGMLLDNRVEGNPKKVFNRGSLLRHGKIGRRF